MKEFQLSTAKERALSISFSIVMIVAFAVLLYAVRSNLSVFIICGVAVTLVTVLLVLYVVSVLKAVCILDPNTRKLEIKGIPSYTVDISNATLLQTLPRQNARTTIRCLVFSDADANIIATIPTFFTYKQGVLAEPMAMEMAKELGIDFKENVPAWQYDKQKLKEHLAEEAEKDKAASRARWQAFLDKLMGKKIKK